MAAKDREFMELALALAKQAALEGEVPVGAVLVQRGRLVGWGANRRNHCGDPSGHAELVALRMACGRAGDWRLEKSTLYVTLEPCGMCTGALVQARVERVVFGCREPKSGAVRSLWAMADDPRSHHQTTVTEGVLADRCQEVLTKFFEKLRR